MPNKERLQELHDFVRDTILEFDMGTAMVNISCGTAGCLLGHAALRWPEGRNKMGPQSYSPDATFFMGLFEMDTEGAIYLEDGNEDYNRLFFPESQIDLPPFEDDTPPDIGSDQGLLRYEVISKEGALITLQRFIDTDVVTWKLEEQ